MFDSPQYACYFLEKIMQDKLLMAREVGSASAALEHLKSLSQFLYNCASDPAKKIQLSTKEEDILERSLNFLFYGLENNQLAPSLLTNTIMSTELRVSMAKIGIFIAFKTERRYSDLLYALNLLSFLLGVIRDCLLNERVEEAHNLLTVGAQQIRDRLNDDTVYDLDQPLTDQILHTFEGCCSSLFVYRALVLFKTANHTELLDLLKSNRQQEQLNEEQFETLSRICFSVGNNVFQQGNFQDAITWLKFAHSLGKLAQESDARDPPNDTCKKEALTLLAACYLQLDGSNNWLHVIELLDFGDDSAVNLELRFWAMVLAGRDAKALASCLCKLFTALVHDSADELALREAAHRVFTLLDGKHSGLIELLDRIPWPGSSNVDEVWPAVDQHIRWICAQYAARCYFSLGRTDELFSLLLEMSQWIGSEPADDPSVREVVAVSESVAINYKTESNSLENCLHWYDVIVTFTNRHGIGISAVCNAIKCSLQLPYPVGYQRANRLFKMISESDWDGEKHLPLRLEFALLAGDFDKAGNMFSVIDLESPTERNSLRQALCRSIRICCEEEEKYDPMLMFLKTVSAKCQSTPMKGILLQLILRIQMDILRNESACDSSNKSEELWADILATFQSAYALTSTLETDMKIWFPRMAWNLGCVCGNLSNSFRHQFFKMSHQFFSLDSKNEKEILNALISAIKAGLAEGENCPKNTVPYVRMLRSCLELVVQFYKMPASKSKSEQIPLINLTELQISCELRNWQKVDQLIQTYLEDTEPKFEPGCRRDAAFFQSAASILIKIRNTKTDEVVEVNGSPAPTYITFVRGKVPWHQSAGLGIAAAKCLLKAMDLSAPHPPLIDGSTLSAPHQIGLYCRWIINALFENSRMMEEPYRLSQLRLMDELRARLLQTSKIPFSELRWIFERIWHAILVCPDKKYKRQLARWLDESLKRSGAHSARLVELFKDQLSHLIIATEAGAP